MTGAPRHLDERKSGLFIRLRREAIEALGSWEAAGVWERICFQAGSDGEWTATVQQIADECQLSLHKTKRALDEIREAGWVTTERAGAVTRTLTWTPLWEDDQVENQSEPGGFPTRTEGKIPSTPLLETEETLWETPTPEPEPHLSLVPDADPPAPKQERRKASQLPTAWMPNDGHLAYVVEHGLQGPFQLAQFRDHHAAKGTTMKDWDAAFRTWLRNAVSYGQGGVVAPPPSGGPADPNGWMRRRPSRTAE